MSPKNRENENEIGPLDQHQDDDFMMPGSPHTGYRDDFLADSSAAESENSEHTDTDDFTELDNFEHHEDNAAPTITGSKRKFKFRLNLSRWLKWVVIIIIVGGLAWVGYTKKDMIIKQFKNLLQPQSETLPPKLDFENRSNVNTPPTEHEVRDNNFYHANVGAEESERNTQIMLRTLQSELINQVQKTNAQLEKQQDILIENARLINSLSEIQQENLQHIANLSQQLSTSNQSIDLLKNKINNFDHVIKQLQADRAKEVMMTQDSQQAQAAAMRNRMSYYVQAIIPGRAWLKSPSGETVTVAIGDVIPGYGRIVSIDSYSGDVVTSSGVVIKYGIAEN